MKNLALTSLFSLTLSACVAVQPATPHPITQNTAQAAPPQPNIPYPTISAQSQINNLGIQIARLQNSLASLETRVQQLERQPNISAPTRTHNFAATPNSHTTQTNAPIRNTRNSTRTNSLFNQAYQAYQRGDYTTATNLLKAADNGGNGSENARQEMYLLLRSHLRLNNCESVILIGNRYASRFRSSNQAPEALYSVAQCQYNLQQKDIARDTWRKIMQIYPDSPAAKRAWQRLNS